jgi:hypothetical protein
MRLSLRLHHERHHGSLWMLAEDSRRPTTEDLWI